MAKLIGINGRIGSGKDTIGMIIQAFTLNKSGEWNVDPVWYCKSFLSSPNFSAGYQIKKYASKLKQIASILTGIPVEKFEDQEFKKTQLGWEWGGITVREFLQRLGTECVRDHLHVNAWLIAAFAEYNENSKWIFTDLRFANEFNAIDDRMGVTIKVTRQLPNLNYNTLETLHPSETALDNHKFKYYIENNGTLEELVEKVKIILQAENII